MTVFIDTSAFFAVLDRDDVNHPKAREQWREILAHDQVMVTTNYVLVETFALLRHRLGLQAVRTFQEDVTPLITVESVGEGTHRSGISALLAASKRGLSLVDCVSFETMRSLAIKKAFAFDPHFRDQGFTCVP
jgi:predicted nucleic acid-binding protein